MPKLPEKYEDWTPPWADGEFDAERAAKLLFNALTNVEKAKETKAEAATEKSDLETRLADAESKLSAKPAEESAKDSEITELRKQVQALEKDGRTEDRNLIDRLEIAVEQKLTRRQAMRLAGKTREELDEDVVALREELGLKDDDGSSDDGRGAPPPSQRPDPRSLGNGRQRGDQQDGILSVDELRRQKADGQVSLPPLAR